MTTDRPALYTTADDFNVVWVHGQCGRCTAEIVFDEASGTFKIDYQS
jgi:hypothetical protein